MKSRTLWKMCIWAALAAVVCVSGVSGAAQQPPSKYDQYLNAVVVVRSSVGEGAGFFVTPDGLLVTNHHVVGGDGRVSIILRTGQTTTGTVIALNEAMDLALVSIPGKSPAWLKLARPNDGGVGADVIAIGTAKGLSWSVSRGIISGLRDGGDFRIGQGQQVLLIQTDAAINPGNSGGPLILLESGRVVGVNTISFKKHIAEGISFAVSADNVRTAFARFLSGGQAAAQQQDGGDKSQEAKARLQAWIKDPQASIARLTQKKSAPVDRPTVKKKVALANAQKFIIANRGAGNLLVVTGRSKNMDSSPVSFIRLKGTLHDEQGKVLQTKMVYSGNFLADNDLETLTMAEIERRLNAKAGFKGSNQSIPPGHSNNFMVVFDHIPSAAREWSINVYSSK